MEPETIMADRPFPIDFSTLRPSTRPNRWLVLPEGFEAAATADQVSPVWAGAEPAALLDMFKTTALTAARTQWVRESDGQIELVQRSLIFRFPDYVTAQAVAVEGGAALCVYSRAMVGYSDLGVNAARIKAWLEAVPNPL